MGKETRAMWGHVQAAGRDTGSVVFALGVAFLIATSVASGSVAADQAIGGTYHSVPSVTPADALNLSSTPSDAEFLHTGLFVEPLAPVARSTQEDNRDLARALVAYRDAVNETGANDAVEPLLSFLAAHPHSPWKPVLQLNLGIIYRQTGHFSKALEIWQTGWSEARDLRDPRGQSLANAMVARLSQLEAYLGRKELLQPLLDSVRNRPIGGTAAQLITDSHTGLYDMQHDPGASFRCGPLALKRILQYSAAHPSPVSLQVLAQSHSTPNGLSLSAVREIAASAGMDYQMAYRTVGAPIIMPAVAHWKVGHYAAIVDEQNGRYLIQDTTFGNDVRMSPETLDEEASGYFLIPAGPLPPGWRTVSNPEGEQVWGRGDTGSNHDGGATGAGAGSDGAGSAGGDGGSAGDGGGGDGSGAGAGSGGDGSGAGGDGDGSGAGAGGGGDGNGAGPGGPDGGAGGGDCPCTTSATELEVVGLQLHDTPVGYRPPVGPTVRFKLYYSHRDTQQPATFSYTNFGPKWTFTWLSYITDSVNTGSSALLYLRGGGNEPFSFSGPSATTSYPGPYTRAVMTRTVNGSGNSTSFTLTLPDGSSEQFNQAVGSQFFMTAVVDRAGNKVSLSYDGQMRITTITDAIGQVTTLTYGLSGSPLVVTKITDPFGRSASFGYNASGLLSSITDILGITSSYMYGQGSDPDFVNTLTTPYGSTSFIYGDSSTNSNLGNTRFLKTVDPLSRTSYVEYDQGVDAGDTSSGVMLNSSLIPTGMNTCDQYLAYRNTFVFDANEYSLASQNANLNYSLGKVVHWMHSSDESNTSRFMESEKQPLENRVWYNYPGQGTGACASIYAPVSSNGLVASAANILPNAIGRVLDNGTTQLRTFQYNSNGNATVATDPLGRQMTYGYASNGIDLLTTYNTTAGSQLLETRTYNGQHLPLTIMGANGKTEHYAYNTAGQPTKYSDQLGHATTLNYDGSGHLKTVQGPIAGAEYSYAYDNVGRVAAATDPAGSTLHFTYDAADRLTETTYPDGTNSKRSYTLLDLTSFTDRLGQKTSYSYDADRELIKTTDPLSHTVEQGYNLAGRLESITDPKTHTTTFVLDTQSRVITKQYANGTTANIAYEGSISLIANVTDALGQITDYNYNSDNTVAEIDYTANNPTPSVAFSYDPIYRRPVTMIDGNGKTTYTYYPVSSVGANLLKSVSSPIAGVTGHDVLTYSYDALNRTVGYSVNGAAQSIGYDALSRTISASNPLDSFKYSYADATPRVTGVTSNQGPLMAMTYFGPTGDELLQQMNITTQGSTSLAEYGYTYNADNNVTSFSNSSPSAQTLDYGYDKANRLLTSTVSGASSPQNAYGYDAASNLSSITASGSTQSYNYTSTNSLISGTYDANGNPTALGSDAYTWDGANRIVSFTGPSNKTSSFTYDGLGRLVRIVDRSSGTVVAEHSYLWCGAMRCLAHDNTQTGSPVSTQYFAQGAIVSGTPYYYVRDQLGSVRQLVTTAGSIATQYTYDPYGNQTTLSGTLVSDIGYAGYFYHAASGLDFAMYRAYDPTHARWLNRDPIAEAGGLNLYAYVRGNPLSRRDPLGLCELSQQQLDDALAAEAARVKDSHALADALAANTAGAPNADEVSRLTNQVNVDIDRYTAAITPNGSGAPVTSTSPPAIESPTVDISDQPPTVDIPSDDGP